MSYEFCIPTRGRKVPHTPDWLHEIKYDGYRLRVERDGNRVRLITRNGYDWTSHYPWIVEAALKNRQKRFASARPTVAASAVLATNRPSAAFESITFIVGPP